MDKLNVKNVLKFVSLVNNLKHTPRAGWVQRNVANPESISAHMYAMAMMSFLIDDKSNLNRLRLMELALVHDLAECIVGDITPQDNVPQETKHKLERDAMVEISKLLGNELGDKLYTLYIEYEEQKTDEAKFVKDLDRFDMISTAFDYEKASSPPNKLQEFFDSTEGKFKHPFVQKLVEELKFQREGLNETLQTEG